MATRYAEVIYEPGSKSVVSYESLDELQAGLKNHHNRAINGEVNGEQGGPSERVHKVIDYGETHPGDYAPQGRVSAETAKALIDGMAGDGGTHVSGEQLISAIRDELSPVYPQDQGRHQSMYKMKGTELPLDFLNEGDGE